MVRLEVWSRRTTRGATLTLVVTMTVILVVVGIGLLGLNALLGGSAELGNAVDAGTLNVAKKAAKYISVPLITEVEKRNFAEFVDADTKGVNLLTYNRVVGRALMVAIGAQQEGTAVSLRNARAVLDAAQTGPNSIGKRLTAALRSYDETQMHYFEQVSGQHSLRMTSAQQARFDKKIFALAYTSRGTANIANVSISAHNLPPEYATALSNISDPNHKDHFFLSSYKPISISLKSKEADLGTVQLEFVTICPDQPHLASKYQLDSPTSGAVITDRDSVPPTIFICGSTTKTQQTGSSLSANAAAVAGSLGSYALEWTKGFVVVKNLPGLNYYAHGGITTGNLLNNEAMTGIYLARTPANQIFFSTDPNKLYAWIYKGAGPGDDLYHAAADGIFDQDGNPAKAADLANLRALGVVAHFSDGEFASLADRINYGMLGYVNPSTSDANKEVNSDTYCSVCTFANMSKGMFPVDVCNKLLTSFERAYPREGSVDLGNEQLLAVEMAKANAIDSYAGSTLPVLDSGSPGPFPDVYIDYRGKNKLVSGIRHYDHGKSYVTEPWGQPADFPLDYNFVCVSSLKFSDIASPADYLSQIYNVPNVKAIGSTKKETLEILLRQVRKMKADVTESDLISVLQSKPMQLGTTYYLCLDQSANLILSDQSPVAYTPGSSDGGSVADVTAFEDLNDKVMNPPNEVGIHDHLFLYWQTLDDATPLPEGRDKVVFTANSGGWSTDSDRGAVGLLGEMIFSNEVVGAVKYSGQN